jgi:LmbE family N-acetylglucosaminyl deacetylase
MSSENNFEKSIVVSAHPDDEILGFSSIVDRVDEVVLCYLNCPSKLSWSE